MPVFVPRRKEELKAAREKRAKELKRGPGVKLLRLEVNKCCEKKIEYFEDGQFGHCNLQGEIHIDFLVSSSKVCGLFQISSVSGGRFGARRLQLSDGRNWSKLFG